MMNSAGIEIALRALEDDADPLERIIRLFGASLGEATLRSNKEDQGFRYAAPDIRHFCFLKAARALSAFHASIELARKGYVQEISVLMRTLVECTTHIEFVLEPDESEEHQAAVKKYVGDFFADHERSLDVEIRQARIS
jgi:DNA primase large subunit